MLNRLRDLRDPVHFSFDGVPMQAERGDTLAVALLAAGVNHVRRTGISGAARGPYCLMGVCFECLVTVDGVQNRQACLIEVDDEMDVLSQQGAPSLPMPVDDGEGSKQ